MPAEGRPGASVSDPTEVGHPGGLLLRANRTRAHARRSTAAVALLAAALLGAGCSADSTVEASPTSPEPSSTTVPAPTTTAAPAPTWPLTGVPVAAGADASRPAVSVKIDNSPDARPHAGLAQADLVYEVRVEGITRFAAVFHSAAADPVGPVRSARSTDIDLLGNLHRPLLVWSGGNPNVTGEVKRAEAEGVLVDVSHTVGAPHYWRQSGRVAPHNLFTNVSAIRDGYAPADATPPGPLFAYRTAEAPVPGDPVPGIQIDYGQGVAVQYVWDAGRGCWARFQPDARHQGEASAFVDESGTQVCPVNVVVQLAEYVPSSADARSPQALTVGEGELLVATGGHLISGRWARPAREAAPVLTTIDGAPIGLAPGVTWVAVPEVGSPVGGLSPEVAAQLSAWIR